jgi:hypothetical protein
VQECADEEHPFGAVVVENPAEDDACGEENKWLERQDPGDAGCGVLAQLIMLIIVLENTDRYIGQKWFSVGDGQTHRSPTQIHKRGSTRLLRPPSKHEVRGPLAQWTLLRWSCSPLQQPHRASLLWQDQGPSLG